MILSPSDEFVSGSRLRRGMLRATKFTCLTAAELSLGTTHQNRTARLAFL
jgi:hypothetical protein